MSSRDSRASGGNSFSGTGYDRWAYEHAAPGSNDTPLNKLQRKYWVTKQAVVRKLGKNEDQHMVASDSELDAKLELFRSICETTCGLQRWIEHYQDRVCNLSYEENCLGRFLKEYGKADKTKAGKMMVAVGKTMSYSGQLRLSIRVPLVRLYQEVETFRLRAIEDTLVTVRAMEKSRTDYRGALMWMMNVSQELDPDTYKQLEKFRKVQGHVKTSKGRFDKMKLDCLQKVDLLAASRCNMFSHALIMYQDALISFWEKTAKTMVQVNQSFQGYQHFEFSYIKDLAEPTRQMCEEGKGKRRTEKKKKDGKSSGEEENKDDFLLDPSAFSENAPGQQLDFGAAAFDDELLNFGDDDLEGGPPQCDSKDKAAFSMLTPAQPLAQPKDSDDALLLADIMNVGSNPMAANPAPSSANAPAANSSNPFGDQWNKVFGGSGSASAQESAAAKQFQAMSSQVDEEFSGFMSGPVAASQKANSEMLLGGQGGSDSGSFLPSQLFDADQSLFATNKRDEGAQNVLKDFPMPSPAKPAAVQKQLSGGSSGGGLAPPGGKADMSQWFNLFADLDPLANPDAIGKTTKEEDKNCYS